MHIRNAALATEDAIRRGKVSAADGPRVWVQHSDDDGLTWSAPLSDDRGATWRIGYVDDNTDGCINANETTAAELPDGRVYFNTRNDTGSSRPPCHPAPAPTPTPPTAAGPW
ncbi:hypothetical protein QF034_002247 [Streptomyces africanus]|uniref:Uncharacterized protein n=1 Tax=Streptomyces africanus TaxID=231024 RepID=A0ABU0QKX1_9ACTN|nr:hypothetical protein [Streptomyces africanus]